MLNLPGMLTGEREETFCWACVFAFLAVSERTAVNSSWVNGWLTQPYATHANSWESHTQPIAPDVSRWYAPLRSQSPSPDPVWSSSYLIVVTTGHKYDRQIANNHKYSFITRVWVMTVAFSFVSVWGLGFRAWTRSSPLDCRCFCVV